jgi:HK97 family phage portal protein
MRILDAVLSRFGYVHEKALGPGMLAALGPGSGESPRPTVHNMRTYLGRYADQAWVNSCVSILASKGSGVPLNIFRKVGKVAEELSDHPLKQLIAAANPFMNGHDLVESGIGFYSLSGNSYWLLDAFVDGKPTEIYPLDPSKVRVRADKSAYVTGYIYEPTPGVDPQPLDAAEVLHFKTWNPLDPFYGLAPISAARDSSDSILEADRYNKVFFENSAETGGVLTTDQPIQEEEGKRILSVWNSTHRGVRKSHKIALLHSGLKWQSTATTQKDMQFPELKRMSREDILSVYHIPPVMVGVFDEANYSNADVQRRIFWLDTMIPLLRKFESVINERLVKPYDPNVFAAFDTSGVEDLQEDKKARAEEDEILTRSGIVTINEAREKRKLPPVDWGEVWNAPFTVSPINEPRTPAAPAVPPAAPPPPEEDPTTNEDPPSPPKAGPSTPSDPIEPTVSEKMVPEDKGKLRRDAVWISFKGLTESMEKRWKPVLRGLFNAQEREVIGNLKDDGERATRQAKFSGMKDFKTALDIILFDGGNARKEWRREGRKLMAATLGASGSNEAGRYDLGTFTLADPRVQKWLDEKAFKFADAINTTTEEALREELKAGVSAGETIDDISRRMEKVFDEARSYRMDRIARTETISASNQGAMAAYEQSGVVQETEWITARDEKVRDSHQIDGEQVNLGAAFSNGLTMPGQAGADADEVINCRCTIAPIVKRS